MTLAEVAPAAEADAELEAVCQPHSSLPQRRLDGVALDGLPDFLWRTSHRRIKTVPGFAHHCIHCPCSSYSNNIVVEFINSLKQEVAMRT